MHAMLSRVRRPEVTKNPLFSFAVFVLAVAMAFWFSISQSMGSQILGMTIALTLVSMGLMRAAAFFTRNRSPILRYIVKQIAWTGVLLIGVTFMLYVLTMISGDPAVSLAGSRASQEVIDNIREVMGLNRPLYVQYSTSMWNWMRGDFGTSFVVAKGYPVWDLLKPRMIISISLGLPSLIIAYVFGTIIGVVAATANVRWLSFFGKRSSSILDTPPILTFLFFSAIPALIFVPTLIWLLVIKFSLLPASGWEGLLSLNSVIPIIALSLPGIAGVALLVRTSCLLVVEQPYVVTARAKGVKRFRILIHHVLRNSLMPLTTQVTASLSGLITGALFIEIQYGIPGMATMMLDAVSKRDFPVYVPATMFIVVLFIIGVRAADIVYTFVDPRVALDSGEK